MQYQRARNLLLEGEANATEVGRELFGAGYELDLAGYKVDADAVYRQTIELLEGLSDSAAVSVSEIAEIAFNHGINLFRLGRFDAARSAFVRCREVLESLVLLDASFAVMVRMAQTHCWIARTKRQTGKGTAAIRAYERGIALWKTLLKFTRPGEARSRMSHQLAASLLGTAKVHRKHGRKLKARRYEFEARLLLEE